MTLPHVSIIILTWNSRAEVPAALEAALASDYPSFDVIVVDNGSTDGTPALIRERWPGLTVLENGRNLGFCGGNNSGMRHALAAGADAVLLLNDDAVVAPDMLRLLAVAGQQTARGGLFGPTVLIAQAPQVILSAGGFLRQGWQALPRGLGASDQGQYDAPPPLAGSTPGIDFLSGCALFATANLLTTIGLLDEAFFAYYEDVEWCWRAQRAGFTVQLVPGARAWHPDTRTRPDGPALSYYLTRNSLLFARKRGLGYAVQTMILLGYLRTVSSWTVRPRWRSRRPQRDAVLFGIRDFLAGRGGAWQP